MQLSPNNPKSYRTSLLLCTLLTVFVGLFIVKILKVTTDDCTVVAALIAVGVSLYRLIYNQK